MNEQDKLFVIQEQLTDNYFEQLKTFGCNISQGLMMLEHIRAELYAAKFRYNIVTEAKAQAEFEAKNKAVEEAMDTEDSDGYRPGFTPVDVSDISDTNAFGEY